MFRMNVTQLGILYVLAHKREKGTTIADFTRELNLTFTTIHTHLRTLEADGLITTDQPAGAPRRGRTVRYFSDQHRIRQELNALADRIAPTEEENSR